MLSIKLLKINIHSTKIRVRYGETDQMGVVYHANYAQYFEVGRTEWLRNLGITYALMEEQGVMLPVISLKVDYKKPAKYDDLLEVKTQLIETPSVRIKFYYEILNQDNEILVTGLTELVFIDRAKNRPMRCPQSILDRL